QEKIFKQLPDRLAQMAMFAVNAGCPDSEICNLRWRWQVKVPELNTIVFIIPRQYALRAINT
ncbi:MAG TPA: site-specific integrase, partial [Gammaproteobacteria bacterium]|nr:site-specific integrase [Gammaproteobacteria bacterium]